MSSTVWYSTRLRLQRDTMNDVDAHDDMIHMPWVDESFMRLRHISRLWRQLVAGEHWTIASEQAILG